MHPPIFGRNLICERIFGSKNLQIREKNDKKGYLKIKEKIIEKLNENKEKT